MSVTMRTTLHIACILAVLLAEGNCLSCESCSSMNDLSCTGTRQTCTSGADVCTSSYTKTSSGSQDSTIFIRSCGRSSDCNKPSSLSGPLMSISIQTTCCNADGCTPPTPVLPAANSTQNGVTCRSCGSATSSSCYTDDIMKCTGLETKCIRYGVTYSGSLDINVGLRGCATPNLCALGSSSSSSEGLTMTTDIACTDSGIRPEHGVFLSFLTGVLLLKNLV